MPLRRSQRTQFPSNPWFLSVGSSNAYRLFVGWLLLWWIYVKSFCLNIDTISMKWRDKTRQKWNTAIISNPLVLMSLSAAEIQHSNKFLSKLSVCVNVWEYATAQMANRKMPLATLICNQTRKYHQLAFWRLLARLSAFFISVHTFPQQHWG